MIRVIIASCALVLVASVGGHAATYWVDDDGGADFLTIQEGVDAAAYGDTVRVNAGYYNEQVVMKNGVALFGSGADCTVIDGTGLPYSTVTCNGLFDRKTRIEGFHVLGGTDPGWSASGVWLGLECSAVVRYNVITGNNMGVLSNYNNGDPVVDHNTIAYNNDCGIQIYVGNWTLVTGVTEITNNIIVSNQYYGIYRGSDGTTADPPAPIVAYNDVWDSGVADYRYVAAAPTDISSDPDFCLPPANLDIETDSPCAGAGSGGSDMGAFEAGCDVVSVEETSWGVIKSLYR